MSPSSHSRKVMAKATKKRAESPYRCDNCGATFESESRRKAHEKAQHSDVRPPAGTPSKGSA